MRLGKLIQGILLFLAAVFVGAILSALLYYLYYLPKNSQPPKINSQFSLSKAPNNSLNGNITSFSGGVGWQSREATEPAKLTSLQQIQQGERITTDATGSAEIKFKDILNLKLDENSDLSIIQTLPNNFVFNQTKGVVVYTNSNNIPISIRTLHLLTDQQPGQIRVSIDKQTVSVLVFKGTITSAYNNLDLVSQLVKVSEGKQLIFQDNTREAQITSL